MPTILDDARSAIFTIVDTVWADTEDKRFDVQIGGGQINWRELVERAEQAVSGGLTPPWCVIEFEEAREAEGFGPTSDAYWYPVSLHYITGLRNPSGGAAIPAATVRATLSAKARAVIDAIRASSAVQSWRFSINDSLTNPMNLYLANSNAQMVGITARAELLVGETA